MRNRFARLAILMGALCVVGTTWAADNAGAEKSTNGCPNQPYPGTIPDNFRLLASCPGAEGGGARSAYTLVGEATVDGRIIYRHSDVLGMYALFVIAQNSISLLPEHFRTFSLNNGDLDRFHLPRLNYNERECYSANATIRITSLHDEGGATPNWPSLGEYEVLKLYNVELHKCGREGEAATTPR